MRWNEFFNRVLAPGTYLARFLLKNYADPTHQISISIFLPESCKIRRFSKVLTRKIGPPSSRYRQLPLKSYNHLSEGIILPYRPSVHPTYPSNFDIPQKIYIFLSLPISLLYIQHVNPPDKRISFSHKRQDLHFIWLSYIFQKNIQYFKNLSGCRFETETK